MAIDELGGRVMTKAAGDHYAYRVRWSGEDEAYVATVAEMPSLSWAAETQVDALVGLRGLVDGVLDDMRATGETAPLAIADREFSGKFMVRIPPEMHRQLAIDAAEQHVSLNRLVSSRLVGA
ncbi:MAG TPA: toxin-antitoxin system HicB family antitoxin [Arachnia sp.]|jgi:predicted RNase H-like HicB family nuclease|nr:toxin-antitoxin system HicB family antitoxin [Arachnia sp.]HQD21035.1 toxin-antitoxin system HicB family antitoxin [Arachnia sp.]